VLNTPENRRTKTLDEQLAAFPYVNGKLLEEVLRIADFDAAMREALLDCCAPETCGSLGMNGEFERGHPRVIRCDEREFFQIERSCRDRATFSKWVSCRFIKHVRMNAHP
jgi:hypothetical protein